MKPSDRYLKWVEWSDEDEVYVGKCPDLITGVHGSDPILLHAELCDVIEEVIAHFESNERELPVPSVRPMRDVV